MVGIFKGIKCTLEDIDVYDALLKEVGTVTLKRIGVIKRSDVVGLQAFSGDCYLGKTLLLTPVSVHYDKWGFPFYRFRRWIGEPSKTSAYEKYKSAHLNWAGY